ncbi:hypothetical protein [Bacillus sp. FSL K6-3431]|uniref:hypothetical protein n=1 Tax=Bacillus sp. FSL K6-3431 TaxID=2921500 RepID=UPI0030FA6EEF
MNGRSLLLIRISALFSVIGAVLGAHMAGSGSYAFRPIHAHILVLGWLTLFAWGVYYEIFNIKSKKIALWQTWTAIVGASGLTIGMWLNFLKPFNLPDGVSLVFYIGGGVIILISFVLFFITTFFIEKKSSK